MRQSVMTQAVLVSFLTLSVAACDGFLSSEEEPSPAPVAEAPPVEEVGETEEEMQARKLDEACRLYGEVILRDPQLDITDTDSRADRTIYSAYSPEFERDVQVICTHPDGNVTRVISKGLESNDRILRPVDSEVGEYIDLNSIPLNSSQTDRLPEDGYTVYYAATRVQGLEEGTPYCLSVDYAAPSQTEDSIFARTDTTPLQQISLTVSEDRATKMAPASQLEITASENGDALVVVQNREPAVLYGFTVTPCSN